MSSTKILVTGGAGYIGSHFILNFLRKNPDCSITVIDAFNFGKQNVIPDKRVTYLQLDLRDLPRFQFPTDGTFDVVVHFAALANVPDSLVNPKLYYDNNIIGGLNLLNFMVEKKITKIIFSSSAAVYGEPTSEIIGEDHPQVPINPYGQTKLMFEKILQDYHQAYGIDSISLRYFCAAGSDESGLVGEYHEPETHAIPILLATALGKRDTFYVYGNDYPTKDGSPIRDYIHVNDLSSAHIAALGKLSSAKAICSAYNLGINKGFTVFELIKAAEEVTGRKINYEIKPRRPGDPSKLIADSTKAVRELQWQPAYTEIGQIIGTAWNFFKNKI